MGICIGKDPELIAQERKNKEITKELKKTPPTYYFSMVGTGESGKSTILKQIKRNNNEEQFSEELNSYKEIIWKNTILAVATAAGKEANPAGGNQYVTSIAEYVSGCVNAVRGLGIQPEITVSLLISAAELRKSDACTKFLESDDEKLKNEGICYFLEHAERVLKIDYTPTTNDVLRCRQKTTSIIEYDFENNGVRFKITDIGGQRSERRKWYTVLTMQDVTAIIFVVALSEYNEMLAEYSEKKRMLESIDVFKNVIEKTAEINRPVILFLNKRDLFEKKIAKIPLTECFPDYVPCNDPAGDYNKALKFIENKFRVHVPAERRLAVKITCALDNDNIKTVMDEIKEEYLRGALVNFY